MMTPHTLKVESASYCTTPSERIEPNVVSVKVGCLQINPTTKRGRRMFLLQMVVLCFVPHVALIAQNTSIMTQLSLTLDSSLYLHTEVNTILSRSELVTALQEERLVIAKLLFSSTPQSKEDRSLLQRLYTASDELLQDLPASILPEHAGISLYHFREDVLNIKNLKEADSYKRLSVYEEINAAILTDLTKRVKSTSSTLWRQLLSCFELVKSIEEISLTLTFATYFISTEDAGSFELFLRHLIAASEHTVSAEQYLEAERLENELAAMRAVSVFFQQFRKYIENKTYEPNETIALKTYTVESQGCLDQLLQMQGSFWNILRASVKREVWLARRTLAIGITILVVVLLASPVLILLLRHIINTIQTFTQSIELSTQKLMAEKQKSDLLLSRMLPLPVLRRLRAQRTVPAESFDAVTIFFSDIVGFTNISATSTPMEVINMLNILYKLFDEKIMQYNVYKVETIGDAYMVVSGLPQRNGNKHVSEIADMSLCLMRSLEGARVPHQPDEPLRIRAGVNTGPCVAGVVGTTMPRYCLFGDTINTASRMESTGEAMKIHISFTTKLALDEIGGYEFESRGLVDVAGKGTMETFWLVGKIGGVGSESPRCLRLHDYGQNLLELLIRS